jgi:hypothetical protein
MPKNRRRKYMKIVLALAHIFLSLFTGDREFTFLNEDGSIF